MPSSFRVCLALIVASGGVAAAVGAAIADDFPVAIEHAFGTTIIPERPARVATVAWANHEVPLALGVVPVGFARANFGDDDGDGLLPWVAERLDELGTDAPPLFNEGDGIDFEGVAASAPDVILAAYSGLSQSDYDKLSKIAPVVAYRAGLWATDWREMIRLSSVGIGMSEEGDALIARIEGQISETISRFPAIEGKSAMFITHLDIRDLSVIPFYTANDTRVKFLADLGLVSPASLEQASADGRYAGEISAERIDEVADVDIIIAYGGQAVAEEVSGNKLTGLMPAVARGSIVLLGNDPLGTAASPTPLAIPWVLEDYVERLNEAALKAQ